MAQTGDITSGASQRRDMTQRSTRGWVLLYLLWVVTVGFGWLVVALYAADQWGGDWRYGSGSTSSNYEIIQAGIGMAASVLAFSVPAWFVYSRTRR